MSLLIDRRAELAGQPGLHALIVGVSQYVNLPPGDGPADPNVGFGMQRLSSPALSAFHIFNWLNSPPPGVRLKVPIKTCRVLVAPSQEEQEKAPQLATLGTTLPTRDAFVLAANEWRNDASHLQKDVTFFYFAGHGFKLSPEDVSLALCDFANPNMPSADKCAKVANIRQGMAPTAKFKNIAREQFYFVDACRNLPEAIMAYAPMTVPDVFTFALNVVDDRDTPTYFATTEGRQAAGRKGQPSVFCEALLHSLGRGSESGTEVDVNVEWRVTSQSLKRALDRYLQRKFSGLAPEVHLLGMIRDPYLTVLDGSPLVDIDIMVVPTDFDGNVTVIDFSGTQLFEPRPFSLPFTSEVPAGIYRVRCAMPVSGHAPFDTPKVYQVNLATQMPLRVRLPAAFV